MKRLEESYDAALKENAQLIAENKRLQQALDTAHFGLAAIIHSSGGKVRIPQHTIETLPPLSKLLFKSFEEMESGDYVVTVDVEEIK